MEYSERLYAPAWYWLVGVAFVSTGMLALGLWFGPEVGIGAALSSMLVIALAIVMSRRTQVIVDSDGVRVGQNVLEWPWAGEATALDVEQTQTILGAGADPSAFVVQRPWLNRVVRIDVHDAADPHPYWLIGTRHPLRLTQAIRRARAGVA